MRVIRARLIMEALDVCCHVGVPLPLRDYSARFPSILRFKHARMEPELQPQRPSRNVPHVTASQNAPFYYIRNSGIMRTRLQSPEQNSQGVSLRAVPVQVARELLNAGHHYLDVRTFEEFSEGHIEGAVNVPYMYKAGSGMKRNLKFLDDVGARFDKDDEIVVGCQIGNLSQMAAAELLAAVCALLSLSPLTIFI